MIHAISQPDRAAGGAPRRILWDDETGDVSGVHHHVPRLRQWLSDATERTAVLIEGAQFHISGCAEEVH